MHVCEQQSSSSYRHCFITLWQFRSALVQYPHFGRAAKKGAFDALGRLITEALASRKGEGIFHDYLNFRFGLRRRSRRWAELIWVIDCKPPAQANRTPELAQIIRSKAPSRLTLLFCDRHCRTALGASSSAPLGATHISKPSRGRFIPIYIVRNLQKLF